MMVVTSWINHNKAGAIASEMSSSSNKNVEYESTLYKEPLLKKSIIQNCNKKRQKMKGKERKHLFYNLFLRYLAML